MLQDIREFFRDWRVWGLVVARHNFYFNRLASQPGVKRVRVTHWVEGAQAVPRLGKFSVRG